MLDSMQRLRGVVVLCVVFISLLHCETHGADRSSTPPLLDPNVDDSDRAAHAAKLLAEYALLIEGVEQTEPMAGVVRRERDRWVVSHESADWQVTIDCRVEFTDVFTTPDTNGDGQIDPDEFAAKALVAYCSQWTRLRPHVDDHSLKRAAQFLRRIDRRIESIKLTHTALSHWNEPLPATEKQTPFITYVIPDKDASGKLLQFTYADHNRRHRLIYYKRTDEARCGLSLRVTAASMGATYSMKPPHASYGRAWLIAEELPTDEKLRRDILQIIQEEAFREPDETGIERRAWLGAVALANLVKTNKFPELRWSARGYMFSFGHQILRDDNRLILLCQPLRTRIGFNPSLPVAVEVVWKDAANG